MPGRTAASIELKALTLAAWIKPAREMGKGGHGNFGDIVGFGARRFVLRLAGQKAPYRLAASLNNSDFLESKVEIQSDRWCHVALTAEPTAEKKWRIRLYLDGKQIHEGLSHRRPWPHWFRRLP